MSGLHPAYDRRHYDALEATAVGTLRSAALGCAFSAAFAHPEARGSMEPSHLIYKVQTWVRSLAEPFMRSLAPCITLLCANVQSSSASEFSIFRARVIIWLPVAELRIVPFIWPHASNGIGCRMHPMVLLPVGTF